MALVTASALDVCSVATGMASSVASSGRVASFAKTTWLVEAKS